MQIMKQEIDATILSILEKMTEEWELLDDSIRLEDKLIENLGFGSVDFVQLFVAIEDKFQQKLGFHDLIMAEGKYVDDLSVSEIVAFVESKLNSNRVENRITSESQLTTTPVKERINPAKVALFQQAIPAPPVPQAATAKNPPAVFILCPSRSGSTLLRVILAGNPQLFAPPELHLLSFETLAQRKAALSNELNAHLLNGIIRAIIQLKGCSAVEAHNILDEWEAQNMTIKDLYRLLQQWLGDRILVDKTPSYTYHVNFLKRAEADFSNALYIHLLRHPYGTMRSFEDAKMDRLLPFMQSDTFSRREYAELAWLVCHQNILEFLKGVPGQRQFQVKFEALVSQTEITVRGICDFIGVDFCPEMLEPYREKSQRMTDGVETVAKMSGDLKFHLHKQIETDMAYRWQKYYTVDFLGEVTWEVAELLGYKK